MPAVNGSTPPPEVTGALQSLKPGGNWEGGTRDRSGRHWVHRPNVGWQPAGPPPHLGSRPGRVYTSDGVRRARRRERLVRWTAGPVLVGAGALVCSGLVDMSAVRALAGMGLAAAVYGVAWWVMR